MGEWVGDPEKEEDFLKERSPITYVDNIKSTINLLIIQGANDPKVVKNESDQIVERLRNKGIGVEYMVFDDEGHGFTKYSNLIKALKKSAEFLANRLYHYPCRNQNKRKGNGYIRKKESLRKPPKRITLVEMHFVYRFKSLTRWVEKLSQICLAFHRTLTNDDYFTLRNSNAED